MRPYPEYHRRRDMRLYIAAQAEAATAFYVARALHVGGVAIIHAQEAGEQAAQDTLNSQTLPIARKH